MRNSLLRRFPPLLLLTATVAGFSTGCATNPVSGTPDLVFMSEAKEIQLGDQYDSKVRGEYGVYPDETLQAYVRDIGEKLAPHSHRPHLKYHFTVLDSPEINAFALPGGYIYISRGILPYFDSEAELAAVLGHELGHVTARHGVRQHSAAMATGVVGAILGAATGIQATQDLFNVFGNAILSGYGREHELESDRLGAEYIARAGYDPQAVIKVISILKNQEEFEKQRAAAENREPRIYHGVFASHPSADKRLQEVVTEADRHKSTSPVPVSREEYLKRIDRLAYGPDAKNGMRHGNSFFHRDRNFALRFPDGWSFESKSGILRALHKDKQIYLQADIEDVDRKLDVAEFLQLRMKSAAIDQASVVEGLDAASHTGTVTRSPLFGKRKTRVAAVYHLDTRLLFQGTVKNEASFPEADRELLEIVRSLHLLTPEEKRLADTRHLRVVRARAGDTFGSLAKKSPISEYAETTLRLINNKYPDGEPVAGEFIKIIE